MKIKWDDLKDKAVMKALHKEESLRFRMELLDEQLALHPVRLVSRRTRPEFPLAVKAGGVAYRYVGYQFSAPFWKEKVAGAKAYYVAYPVYMDQNGKIVSLPEGFSPIPVREFPIESRHFTWLSRWHAKALWGQRPAIWGCHPSVYASDWESDTDNRENGAGVTFMSLDTIGADVLENVGAQETLLSCVGSFDSIERPLAKSELSSALTAAWKGALDGIPLASAEAGKPDLRWIVNDTWDDCDHVATTKLALVRCGAGPKESIFTTHIKDVAEMFIGEDPYKVLPDSFEEEVGAEMRCAIEHDRVAALESLGSAAWCGYALKDGRTAINPELLPGRHYASAAVDAIVAHVESVNLWVVDETVRAFQEAARREEAEEVAKAYPDTGIFRVADLAERAKVPVDRMIAALGDIGVWASPHGLLTAPVATRVMQRHFPCAWAEMSRA